MQGSGPQSEESRVSKFYSGFPGSKPGRVTSAGPFFHLGPQFSHPDMGQGLFLSGYLCFSLKDYVKPSLLEHCKDGIRQKRGIKSFSSEGVSLQGQAWSGEIKPPRAFAPASDMSGVSRPVLGPRVGIPEKTMSP